MIIDSEYNEKEIKDSNAKDKKSNLELTFLSEYGFDNKEIAEAVDNTPKLIANQLDESNELVGANVNFLKELGVKNYKEVFINYSDMFLMDHSKFKNIFLKYDKEDLIEKIFKNIAIIEHL